MNKIPHARFRSSSAAFFLAAFSLCASSGLAQMASPTPFPDPKYTPAEKKGIGIGVNKSDWARKVRELKVAWFYRWDPAIPGGIPAGVEFVPMVRSWNPQSGSYVIGSLTAARKAKKFTTLLGFNEPDGKDQANMSVETALAAWPQLESVGARLGSPAGVHPDVPWMTDFMRGVKMTNMRVDFITVHWYGSASQAADFLSYLARIHILYNKPIWITEFCPADWQAGPNHKNMNTPQQVEQFMRAVIPALKRTSYIERYAWFSADPDSFKLGTGALFKSDGSLTDLGKIYAAY